MMTMADRLQQELAEQIKIKMMMMEDRERYRMALEQIRDISICFPAYSSEKIRTIISEALKCPSKMQS